MIIALLLFKTLYLDLVWKFIGLGHIYQSASDALLAEEH